MHAPRPHDTPQKVQKSKSRRSACMATEEGVIEQEEISTNAAKNQKKDEFLSVVCGRRPDVSQQLSNTTRATSQVFCCEVCDEDYEQRELNNATNTNNAEESTASENTPKKPQDTSTQREKKRKVAVKVQEVGSFPSGVDALEREFHYGSKLSHPNLVKYFRRFEEKDPHILAFHIEFCDSGDLHDYIQANRKEIKLKKPTTTLIGDRSEKDNFWHFCSDMLLGLEELHRNELAHLDFCPSNVFLQKSSSSRSGYTLKIGDFGTITKIGPSKNAIPSGKGDYQAPERKREWETFECKSSMDIYSLGLTCVAMITGLPHLSSLSSLPTQVQEMISLMLLEKEDERSTAREILDIEQFPFEVVRPSDVPPVVTHFPQASGLSPLELEVELTTRGSVGGAKDLVASSGEEKRKKRGREGEGVNSRECSGANGESGNSGGPWGERVIARALSFSGASDFFLFGGYEDEEDKFMGNGNVSKKPRI